MYFKKNKLFLKIKQLIYLTILLKHVSKKMLFMKMDSIITKKMKLMNIEIVLLVLLLKMVYLIYPKIF